MSSPKYPRVEVSLATCDPSMPHLLTDLAYEMTCAGVVYEDVAAFWKACFDGDKNLTLAKARELINLTE